MPIYWGAFCDDEGHLGFDDPASWRAHLRKFVGKSVLVSVKRKSERQGSQSMRFYRGIVVPDIARACGYSDPDDWQDVHDALAFKFLRLPDHPELGTPRRRSTAKDDLTAAEMTDYISACIEWAESSIPGCHVRRPDEVDDMGAIYAPEFD